MSTTEILDRETTEAVERCSSCSAPMALDQHYCLSCGARRGDPRLPFAQVMAVRPPGTAAAQPPPPPQGPAALPITWPVAAGGAAVLVLALGVGVLIGNSTSGGSKVASGTPQVITVGNGTGTAGSNASSTSFKSDWPAGKTGYTVQLQSLRKNGTDPSAVAAAKNAAKGKGAPDVGALDSDSYSSLKPGLYVIYSGVFDNKKDAQHALSSLKKKFPSATVVKVGKGGSSSSGSSTLPAHKKSATLNKSQLEKLNGLSPQQYQKQSSKLPDTIRTQGAPAPKDNKPAGGGSGSETIK